ncbi:YibE/F family protein [Sinanaerobacter sp. ZZT-01]|uniref:YibE/F family protein n=1 Tax=Sinanaerobacter sp. ZZT-01 TaxID=3111540 RepID=UPI002D79E6B8|nr:YibE/F family protein [Sinanaerobacter sp. ZZT-01]WRR94150.1 YibE/F family protein [Sinanaerobacter sp. ZZT-01]
MKLTKRKMNDTIWILTLAISILLIFVGNRIVSKDLDLFVESDSAAAKANVVEIIGEQQKDYSLGGQEFKNRAILFKCKILNGEQRGKTVTVSQILDESYAPLKEIELKDKVIIYNYPSEEFGTEWVFGDFARLNVIIWMSLLFFVLMIILGGKKGINTILSLSLTCLAVFAVFIPSVLNGYNIYITSLLTCIYTIIMTLLLVNGMGKKTLATICGCVFGVIVSALLTVGMDQFLYMTGYVDEHSVYLHMMNVENPIDLKAVIFGAIVIGAMGAVMDVAMDIASSLYEIQQHMENISFHKLVRSGLTIGRDIMGTMSNTLVLAYIGSSFSSVLLLITYTSSMTELLNREQIIAEILQALVGSTAILLTIPLTAVVCGILYTKKSETSTEIKKNDEK